MASQWAEKHECLLRSRSTGFSFRGAGLSLPLLADAWSASGLPQDLCTLPACGTLELKTWLLVTQPTPPLSHAACTRLVAARHSTTAAPHLLALPAFLQPPSAHLFNPGPCHSHGDSHTPAAGRKEGATARCLPKPAVSQWQCWQPGIKSQGQGCPCSI